MESNNNNNNHNSNNSGGSYNPFNDFFRQQGGEQGHAESGVGASDGREKAMREEAPGSPEQTDERAEKSSHYFAYGPYQRGAADTTSSDSAGSSPVEVTPPKPVRPLYMGDGNNPGPGQWQFSKPEKKSSGFRSLFASFMAGVVVVGALMFASDKMNLFTGAEGVMAGPGGGGASAAAPAAGSGAVRPTALDMSRPNNIAAIVEQSSPAVVKIETKVKAKSSRGGSSFFNDPFFRQFFGDDFGSSPQDQNQGGQLQPGGMGTGFIFEKSGYILTNEHVIDGADEIWVYVQDHKEPFKAELLGNSYDLDLAALKITPESGKEFPTLPLGSADDLREGDWVVAIGNPYGFDHTVTVGVLSAKERPISIPDANGTRNYKHLLQTDASINPGNSGGPLLNLNGEVIGINTAVSAQAQGIGFAIPTSTISSVLENLKNNVKIPKEPVPYVGISMADIDKEWVAELKLENNEGAIVSQVERKSPAFAAGIRPYDVIVDLNGTKVKTPAEVSETIKKMKVGDKVTIGIMRDGKKQSIEVTIGNRNAE
ncbi:serine protease, S1-C subfamily, contains C-terminal PDZ domain [Paenibacillus sp. UNCCL117]|uniref:S1C family serine protease n=1 Tax=unclassified Paenibacillus TaxID=185978 RepID=UPI000882E9A1|nr:MULTISPECIES: trypsin-like peptidase domain-containing protein [unclassified Paenibacillus]SDC01851.1 serine protease, S1-C subfamily, contains C-terminal PDZ domain [Paenibacillus sp. cl123]SFW36724.1 serine protease, S1-C subfamily, contains C-terminal PDZ domain [Paenibacillus sp. UNCCL117]